MKPPITVPQIESKGFFTCKPPREPSCVMLGCARSGHCTPSSGRTGMFRPAAGRVTPCGMNLTSATRPYAAKKWNLSGLHGISDATLELHFGLYEGYVKNTNLLNERLAGMRKAGTVSGADPSYAELVRRLGFEFNGMRLHELYFDNLRSDPKELRGGALADALGASYGSPDDWKKDFAAVGGMRGVGWAIAYYDPTVGAVSNHWVGDHENGTIAGCIPIVVMDLWEHAYLKDYKPAEKGKYVEAFLANLDWEACEARLP